MKAFYWPCLALAVGFLVWADTHTDEVPVVLGFVLIAGAVLGAAFPDRFVLSAAVTGGALFLAETLVHFSTLPAPYPPGANLPWPALFGYVPALIGVAVGVAMRRRASG
jgi:hypothetical protein